MDWCIVNNSCSMTWRIVMKLNGVLCYMITCTVSLLSRFLDYTYMLPVYPTTWYFFSDVNCKCLQQISQLFILEGLLRYLVYCFCMMTYTMSPFSRFLAYLLPVFRKWLSGGTLCMIYMLLGLWGGCYISLRKRAYTLYM